jgi:hypothetical protein
MRQHSAICNSLVGRHYRRSPWRRGGLAVRLPLNDTFLEVSHFLWGHWPVLFKGWRRPLITSVASWALVAHSPDSSKGDAHGPGSKKQNPVSGAKLAI